MIHRIPILGYYLERPSAVRSDPARRRYKLHQLNNIHVAGFHTAKLEN